MKSICGIDCTNCELRALVLHIPDMEKVTELNALKGSFANIEYALPNGQIVKFWDDNKIYLGNQLHKKGSDRCYGIIADEKYLMVSKYSGYGDDAKDVPAKTRGGHIPL